MKIRMYYESKLDKDTIILDVPDEECEIMVERDYQQRVAEAAPENRAAVTRRDPQTIIDEECNKPTFNGHHRETRRHIALDVLDPEGDHISDGTDLEGTVCEDEQNDLYRAIAQLTPEQQALVRKIYWEEIGQRELAQAEGVTDQALHNRMSRIYKRLKSMLEK